MRVAELVDEAQRTADSSRLRDLSAHTSMLVRTLVAYNRASDDDTIARLLDDKIAAVRFAAATNLAGRAALQRVAVDSSEKQVRANLAGAYSLDFGVSLPYDIQAKLAADDYVECRSQTGAATNYLDLFEALLADPEPRVRAACAANPRVTREQMERLVTDRAAVVRSLAARNGFLFPDDEQLMRLAVDRSARVRWAVIFRVDRPREALELIAADADEINSRHAKSALHHELGVHAFGVAESERSRRRQAVGLSPFRAPPRSPI